MDPFSFSPANVEYSDPNRSIGSYGYTSANHPLAIEACHGRAHGVECLGVYHCNPSNHYHLMCEYQEPATKPVSHTVCFDVRNQLSCPDHISDSLDQRPQPEDSSSLDWDWDTFSPDTTATSGASTVHTTTSVGKIRIYLGA